VVCLEVGGELVGEEARTHLSHALLICLKGSLTGVEVDLVGQELTAPVFKHVGDIFFLLSQLLLPLCHHSLLLANSDRMPIEVLLLLDSGVGTGLSLH
jgi:hypothetical protein